MIQESKLGAVAGFTILELSLVLVIIGLVIGGVLGSQALIHSAQLQSIATEKDRYAVAINAFKEKYQQLPGDFARAYQVWGTACGTDTGDPSAGCNGNGDRFIVSASDDENIKAWEHLAKAGLVEGSYNGTGTVNGVYVDLSATNIPASKLPGAYWEVDSMVQSFTSKYEEMDGYYKGVNAYESPYSGVLHLGPIDPSGLNMFSLDSPFTRAEAFSLDTKIDDGHSSTGVVRGHNNLPCSDNGADIYGLTDDRNAKDCILHFIVMK